MTNVIDELKQLKSQELDAGLVFSGTASGRMIKGYSSSSSFTPEVDVDYLFHHSSRDVVVWLMDASDPLYVFGPAGSGKTSLIKQLSAKLNYPVFEVNGHGRLEYPELVGHLTVDNGNMKFQYGPLALSMKFGGLFLLNEIDLLDPSTAIGLNGILDGEPLCIPENGGEVIMPHPSFRFAATANTNGGNDDTGLYQGTLRQNLAFMDRFWLCEIGYPTPEAEKELLSRKVSSLPEDIRAKMVELANAARKLFMGEADGNYLDTIEVTFSTRTLIRWADLTIRFQPLARQGIQPVTYALDRAIGYRACQETRTVLHELAQRIFPCDEQQQDHI
ncbi:MAG: AAA family ATPase [Desulfobacterium sp.]|nr:AAA family ATPase [Desulfobacterium sp.]